MSTTGPHQGANGGQRVTGQGALEGDLTLPRDTAVLGYALCANDERAGSGAAVHILLCAGCHCG
jgi:hypothetical protein